MDAEHAELLAFLDGLRADVDANASPERVESILNQVSAMLRKHFFHEESIMLSCGLPKKLYWAHVEAHMAIIEELTEALLACMRKQSPPFPVLLEQISRWIATHLIEHDMALKQHINHLAPPARS